MKKATVVVPTLGRLVLLRNCLEGIRGQSYSDFELLVVHDNSNTEEVRDLVNSHGGRYLRSPQSGCVPTYNAGLISASSEVVAFTDDDAVPDPDWLSQLMQSYSQGVGGVGGTVIEISRPQPIGASVVDVVPVDHLSGANMSFQRDAIVKTGVFDYNYRGDGFRFESDYCMRVRRKGFKILYNPRARVVHWGSKLRRVPKGWNTRRAYYYNRNDTYFSLRNLAVAKTANYVVFDTTLGITMRILRRARNMAKRALVNQDVVWLFSLVGLLSGVRVYHTSRMSRNYHFLPTTNNAKLSRAVTHGNPVTIAQDGIPLHDKFGLDFLEPST